MPKSIPDPGFSGDDGGADPTLAATLAAFANRATDAAAVYRALAGTRVLVAVIAVALEVDASGADKATDMSVITVRGEDGRTAMPAFTSLEALVAWHAEARPVPVEIEKACLAAIVESYDLVVLDPAGPVTFVVEGPAMRALAQGRVPVPPVEDPAVVAAVRAVLAEEPGIAAAGLVPAQDADAVLALVPASDLDAGASVALAQRVAIRLADDPVLRERLDRGLDLALLAAGTDPPGVLVVDRLVG